MEHDARRMAAEAAELLTRLIDIPSTSRDEQAAADCLQAYVE